MLRPTFQGLRDAVGSWACRTRRYHDLPCAGKPPVSAFSWPSCPCRPHRRRRARAPHHGIGRSPTRIGRSRLRFLTRPISEGPRQKRLTQTSGGQERGSSAHSSIGSSLRRAGRRNQSASTRRILATPHTTGRVSMVRYGWRSLRALHRSSTFRPRRGGRSRAQGAQRPVVRVPASSHSS